MDELRKASILLRHLAPTERVQILGQFDPEQREQLQRTIAEASEVPHAELVEIVSEYQSWLQQVSVKSTAEPEACANAEADGSSAVESDRMRQIRSKDAASIVNKLSEEPATVLAAVLCELHESTAWEVYESLSADRQAAVVSRLPVQRELKPVVKQELACFLDESVGIEPKYQPGNALLARLVGP